MSSSNHTVDETDLVSGSATEPESDALSLVAVGESLYATLPIPSRGQLTLGREAETDVSIAARGISRQHAVLDLGPPLRIRDADSKNGVFVRGKRLEAGEWSEIALGEVFRLGSVMVTVQRGLARASLLPPAPAPYARPTLPPSPPPPATRAESPREIVVVDPVMQDVHRLVARVSSTDINLLILGETGVGKEVVADWLHRSSRRADRPFLKLNCAALAPELLESELFGHEKGAFTGAATAKAGLLETADGGTVFLDEVGEMQPALQAKLLRVLETRLVLRVGGLKPRPIDVRFVAATNRDLRAEVARGTFREDLYFRLCGMSLAVPPLRERPSEIGPLTELLTRQAAAAAGIAPPPVFTPAAMECLRRYRWPGNVRELRNVVQRAVVLSEQGTVDVGDLPPEVRGEPEAMSRLPSRQDPAAATAEATSGARAGSASLRTEIERVERECIIDALQRCHGNQTRAAAMLKMPLRTFVKRLELYGIPRPRKRGDSE